MLTQMPESWLRVEFGPDAFADPEAAWDTVQEWREALFTTVARLDDERWLKGSPLLFVGAAGARGLGLSLALAREGRLNRHAAWPLLRSLVDTVMVALEVRRNPAYANVVIHRPQEWQPGEARHRSQKLIANARSEAPRLKPLWDFLSDGDHFGPLGFAQAVESQWQAPDGTFSVMITSDPAWHDDRSHIVIGRHTASLLQGLTLTLEQIMADQLPPRTR